MNDNLKGMKFLDKVFKDLYKENSVSRYGSNKYQNIDSYMKKLEHISNGNHKKLLIKILVDNYVIKEENIPADKDKINIIFSQRNRLEEWLTYLSDDNCVYPMWVKYWVFRSLVKIGTYSKFDKVDQVRSKKTISSFIEFNAEALARTVYDVIGSINGESLNDDEVDKLVKSGSFKKIYRFYLDKFKEKTKTCGNEGVWVKYNQGTDDYIKLCESLQGYNTGWCTSDIGMAKHQVCGSNGDSSTKGGDFYVYYSVDKNGLYKIPRIAIRMCGHDKIGEIRGIDDAQNLESGLEDILESKLEEMSFLSKVDKKRNLEKINNCRYISNIISKVSNGEILSIEDIRVVYGIKELETFGQWDDKTLEKLKQIRNHQVDFDRLDKDDKVKLLSHYSILKILCDDGDVLLEACKYNRFALMYADAGKIENYDKLAMEAVKQDWRAFEYVDGNRIEDYETFATEALKQNLLVFEYVDGNRIEDYETLALDAVKQAGGLIHYVDKSLVKDYETLALEAVKQAGTAFGFVDKSLIKDYDKLAMEAVKQNKSAILFVDNSLIKDYEKFAMEVVKQNWYVFKHVAKSLIKDYDKLAMEAVKQDWYAFKYVDKSMVKDYETLALDAVKQACVALSLVDKSLVKDYDKLVMEAVKQDWRAFIYVDGNRIENYDKVLMKAIKQDLNAAEYANGNFIKNPLRMAIYVLNRCIIIFVSEKFKNICDKLSLKRSGGISTKTKVTINLNNTKIR